MDRVQSFGEKRAFRRTIGRLCRSRVRSSNEKTLRLLGFNCPRVHPENTRSWASWRSDRDSNRAYFRSATIASPTRLWEFGRRSLIRKSCSFRLFGAPSFAQQAIILSRVVAFQAIECVIRRLDGGNANLLFRLRRCPSRPFPNGPTFPQALAASWPTRSRSP
jgi:hypothetical protein